MPFIKCCSFILLGMMLCCGIGCSENLQVKGTVTFSDDGTPLDIGMILFESGAMVSRGNIKEGGAFTLSSEKQNDGIPPGTYKVYFSGALKTEAGAMGPKIIPLVADKYNSASTTDIAITIDQSTKSPLEIKVDRPGTK